MSTIVTRAGKGAPLTNTEMDSNLTNLNTDKFEIGGTYSGGTANTIPFLNGSKVLSSTTGIQFDGTNLGVGVTPSAWSNSGTTWRAIQAGSGSNFVGRGDVVQTQILTNAYYNGTNYIYQNSTTATQYYQYQGTHAWGTAASGTAGNAITFTQAMTLDASGKLWVNTASAWPSASSSSGVNAGGLGSDGSITSTTNGSSAGYWNRNNTSGDLHRFYLTGTQVGSISVSGSTTTYSTSSDYRLKEDVQPITGALATVAQLKPCTYTWKATGEDGQGFIAHELQAVVPDAVVGEKDATELQKYEISPAVPATFDEEGNELTPAVEAVMGEREVPVYQGIDTSFLVATLTAAIQEQQIIIQQLQADVEALKGASK